MSTTYVRIGKSNTAHVLPDGAARTLCGRDTIVLAVAMRGRDGAVPVHAAPRVVATAAAEDDRRCAQCVRLWHAHARTMREAAAEDAAATAAADGRRLARRADILTAPMARVAVGGVAHRILTDGTACGRPATATLDATGARVCAACARLVERAERERAAAVKPARVRTLAMVRDYAERVADESRRHAARRTADDAADGGTTLQLNAEGMLVTDDDGTPVERRIVQRTTSAAADRASQVAPIGEGVYVVKPFGRGSEFHPLLGDGTAQDAAPVVADAWSWVTAHTFGSRFMARIMARLITDSYAAGWRPTLHDRDDAAQYARCRVVDEITRWCTRPDVIRHAACACPACARPDAVVLADGTRSFTWTKVADCGACASCRGEDDGPCATPVERVEHVTAGTVVYGTVKHACREFMRARYRRGAARADYFGTASDAPAALHVGATPDDGLDAVPPFLADVVRTLANVCRVAGEDVVGTRGDRLSDTAMNAAAFMLGHVTIDDDGTPHPATPAQRRAALDDLRAAWRPVTPDGTRPDDDATDDACACHFSADGRLVRACLAHGGVWRWIGAWRVEVTGGTAHVSVDGGRATPTATPTEDMRPVDFGPVTVRPVTADDVRAARVSPVAGGVVMR